jgi:hypothetical protein
MYVYVLLVVRVSNQSERIRKKLLVNNNYEIVG